MASQNSAKPNVLFILSDDQGPWAMGCTGNSEIQTPHLDALAASGIRFSNFYCTSPVCSPARASLMTGKMPSQHGVHDWIKGGNYGEEAIQYLAGQIGYTDLLAAAGYKCGLSGKWHMGDSLTPQMSFSHWYVHREGGGPYYNAPMIRDGKLVFEERYVTDCITDDAIEYLEAQVVDQCPFYLGVHYTAPHSPWINNHPSEYVALYDDCPFLSCPQEPKHPWVISDNFKDAWQNPREHLKGYFAAVTAMDAGIGRIMKRLKDLNLIKTTLVFFLGDNGFNCGHHGIWGKGNGTFPQNMYDTSVQVPAIASLPGRIAAGLTNDALISGYDFMPTLLDYLGLQNPYTEGLPGHSLAALLRGEPDSGHETVVVYNEYGPVRMVRSRKWKYVHRYPYGPNELYNLEDDPSERVNLINEHAHRAVAADLKASLDEWFLRFQDPPRTGVHQPVTGKGQLRLCGPAGNGKKAFAGSVDVSYVKSRQEQH